MRNDILAFSVIHCGVMALAMVDSEIGKVHGGLPPVGLDVAARRVGDDPPRIPNVVRSKPKQAKANDDELRKLMIDRFNVALLESQKRFADEEGAFAVNFVAGGPDQCVKRLFHAELSLAENPQERIEACRNYVEMAKYMEDYVALAIKNGGSKSLKDPGALEVCRSLHIDAKIQFIEAKRQAKPK